MPAKPRHRKGKYAIQGKNGTPAAPKGPVSQIQPLDSAAAAANQARTAAPPPKPSPLRYLYITSELKTIAILGVAMLTILVVLALVLS